MSAPIPPSDDLQFARAEPTTAFTPDSDASAAPTTCAECKQPIATEYWEAGGQVLCEACKGKIERVLAGEGTSRGGRVARALVFGGLATVLGAVIWFAVAALFNLEIGLIAILIGWMVGRAVRAGSAGRGGRRYQVMAALLTYFSVALSYGALGIREMVKSNQAAVAAAADSAKGAGATARLAEPGTAATPSAATPSAATPAPAAPGDSTGSAEAPSAGGFATAVALMLGFMFVLPILANLSSMPGGLIGLAILAFGILQAWNMNAAVQVVFSGPHRVGARPDTAPDATPDGGPDAATA